jgi:uncharacterized protein YcfJ
MKKSIPFVLAVGALLQACSPAATPYEQQQRQHEIACLSGTVGGAILGGAIGSAFGSGTGKDIMIGAGATAGGLMGNNYSC